jgi:hypothetical protein
MSTERETTRIVRSWLETDGRTTLPDWVRSDVLDRLPSTPQRRSSRSAWRFTNMNGYAKLLVGAAAVIAVAVVGINLLPGQTGPAAPPSPTPSLTPAPTATPEPISNLPNSGPVAAGTYRVTSTNILITMPSGWDIVDGRDIRKNRDLPTEVTLLFWRPDIGVHADACKSNAPVAMTGPTADDLLAAVRAQASTDLSEPVDVTFGDIAAQQLTVSPSEGIEPSVCDNTLLQVWTSPTANGNWFGLTQPATFYVSETEAGRVVFMKGGSSDSPAEDVAELDAMMESMVYEK